MVDVTLELRGDQIGRYTSFSGSGNNQDRVVVVQGVEALGTASDTFTVFIEQASPNATEFANGQFVTVFNAAGDVVVPRTGINPDAEQGRASGDEHLLLTQQPFLIDLGGVPVGPETVTYDNTDDIGAPGVGDNDGNLDFADFPCFATGTHIATPRGDVRVEDLKAGDTVLTLDGPTCPVRWVGQRVLRFSNNRIKQKPVMLRAGCLGPDMPERNLVLSPQHRVLLAGEEVAKICRTGMALGPARGLETLQGVRVMAGRREVTYVSVLLERHSIMLAEGCPVESLYPGPQALRSIGKELAKQVFACVPGLKQQGVQAYGPPAQSLLTMRETRELAQRLRQRQPRPRTRAMPESSAVAQTT